MSTVTMYDDVDVSLLPPGAPAYAGYINGNWPNAAEIQRKFPNAKVIRISISASTNDGACLDVESGDAINESAAGWVKMRLGHTVTPKPWVYTSASNVANLVAALGKGGVARDKYFVWSAHYTNTPHICSPSECGYPQADGTQWTNKALGRSLDASVIRDYMLPGYVAKPTPPKPVVVTPKPVAPVKHPVIDAARNKLSQALRNNPNPGPIRRAIIAAIHALRGIR